MLACASMTAVCVGSRHGSLRLYVRVLDDLREAHVLAAYEAREVLGGAAERLDAGREELLLEVGRRERLVDLAVQAAHDRGRRPGGREHAIPDVHHEVRE